MAMNSMTATTADEADEARSALALEQIPDQMLDSLARWMSISSAAARLGISRNWMHKLCVQGRVRSVMTEVGYLIDPVAVEEYAIEQMEVAEARRVGVYQQPRYRAGGRLHNRNATRGA